MELDGYIDQIKQVMEPFVIKSGNILLTFNIDLRIQGLFLGVLLFVFLAWFSMQKPIYQIKQEADDQ